MVVWCCTFTRIPLRTLGMWSLVLVSWKELSNLGINVPEISIKGTICIKASKDKVLVCPLQRYSTERRSYLQYLINFIPPGKLKFTESSSFLKGNQKSANSPSRILVNPLYLSLALGNRCRKTTTVWKSTRIHFPFIRMVIRGVAQ